MLKAFIFHLFLFLANVSLAYVENDPLDVWVILMISGFSGVLQQMETPQSSTKMLNGDESIYRFFRTEFKKLGKTQKKIVERAEFSIPSHRSLWMVFRC